MSRILLPLVVALLSVVPQVWAYFKTPSGYFFTGINTTVNLNDIQGVYFSAIRNFSRGDILYRNPFDLKETAFFHYPLYFVLGKIVSITSLPVEVVYQLASFLLTFVFLIFVFKFLGVFSKDFRQQLLAFGLLNFGGFLASVAEGIGFFSFSLPHFVLAQLALFASLYLLLVISTSSVLHPLQILLLLVSNLTLAMIHPWMTILLFVFLCSWLVLMRVKGMPIGKGLVSLSVLSLSASPFLIYWGNTSRVPWVSFNLSSSISLLPLLYGPLLIVALWGAFKIIKDSHKLPFLFLLLWTLVQLIFVYLPLPFQRRFIEGFYFPLAILAVAGVDAIIRRFNLQKSSTLIYTNAFVYLSLGVIANYLVLFTPVHSDFIYRKTTEREAMLFLDDNSKPWQRVLSTPIGGTFIASFADLKIFAGHGIQTPDFDRKSNLINQYFSGQMTQAERADFILRENICFVYLGPDEKKIAKINLNAESNLGKFFENGEVEVYQAKACNSNRSESGQ